MDVNIWIGDDGIYFLFINKWFNNMSMVQKNFIMNGVYQWKKMWYLIQF